MNGIGRARSPSARHASTSSPTACGGPETTTFAGPFTTATTTSGKSARRAVTSSTGRSTAAIAPVPARVARARARRITAFAASSNDSTPATHAAAISPCE
ncbi:hypothetical protein B0E53_07102 [Micromonospora sp. MH33]|nr:hypothetical protein B0E53_07102 [Micromonospora sp. MH33]